MVLSTARVIQHFGCAWPLAYCAFPQSPRHAPDLHEPFKVQISGGLCDSGPSPSSNPEIMIDSNGTDSFVVTSILVKRALMNPVDFSFFSVNTVQIDGTSFDTRTGTLFGPLGGHSPKPPGRRLLRHPPAPSGSAPARRGVRRSGLHCGAGHRGVSRIASSRCCWRAGSPCSWRRAESWGPKTPHTNWSSSSGGGPGDSIGGWGYTGICARERKGCEGPWMS